LDLKIKRATGCQFLHKIDRRMKTGGDVARMVHVTSSWMLY
jgi:hypothetical protein